MKLDRSIKLCVNEIYRGKDLFGKFPQHIGLFFFNTIAAATEYDIKQTKPNQEGLELHGTP
jgi:hypothetical protein